MNDWSHLQSMLEEEQEQLEILIERTIEQSQDIADSKIALNSLERDLQQSGEEVSG